MEAKKLQAEELPESWKDVEEVLHFESLLYVSEIICFKLMSRHYDDFLTGHFKMDKMCKLIARIYQQPMLRQDVNIYIKGCNVYLALKAIRHKPYGNPQALLVPTHCLKNILMNFITSLPFLADQKDDNYDSILVIISCLTKIVYYEMIKVTIDTAGLIKVIIDMVV